VQLPSSNDFVPPPGATRTAINSSVMGWVDENGVVLHSWRKTKRGTRGGGQRGARAAGQRRKADSSAAPAAAGSTPAASHEGTDPSQPSRSNSAAEGEASSRHGSDRAKWAAAAGNDGGEAVTPPLQAALSGALSCATAAGSEAGGGSERGGDGSGSGLVTPRLRERAVDSDVAGDSSSCPHKVDGVMPLQPEVQSSEAPKQLQQLLVRHSEVRCLTCCPFLLGLLSCEMIHN
jgi:hypothetical protein